MPLTVYNRSVQAVQHLIDKAKGKTEAEGALSAPTTLFCQGEFYTTPTLGKCDVRSCCKAQHCTGSLCGTECFCNARTSPPLHNCLSHINPLTAHGAACSGMKPSRRERRNWISPKRCVAAPSEGAGLRPTGNGTPHPIFLRQGKKKHRHSLSDHMTRINTGD